MFHDFRDSLRSLLRSVKKRDILALGRTISILEDNLPLKSNLLRYLKSRKNDRVRGYAVGITGSAGSGKSTLITALAKVMRRNRKSVAIIAVDPTSPKTGGAFLGDRVRMQELAEDPGVFIRSMASRGARGGIARATKDVARLLLKAGYDFILIETVGAGQLDFEVTKIADLTLLVLTPEAGDEMQLMKAGLRELADAFIVNKADRPGAQKMEDFLKQAIGTSSDRRAVPVPLRDRFDSKRSNKNLSLPCRQAGRPELVPFKTVPPVFRTIAEQRKGIENVYRFILRKYEER
ncbi:MAG: ATP/GTP-binding protein [Candidatus Omnitrophica bacterium]|nr:ATP/GTP-binding protein [Candidatus Omnitrophota bacterium]